MVHAPLESGRSISQPHWHDQPLIVPLVGSKCCFLYMLWVDLYLIVSTHEINFRENARPMQLIYKIICSRQGILVRNGLFIEHSVVYTESQCPILLWYKDDR